MKLIRTAVCLCVVLPWSGSLIEAQVTFSTVPSRLIGQKSSKSYAPNQVEGRELWSPQSVAVDTSATPAILYVSDTLNNRVLAWRDATKASAGVTADLVIGQPDLISTGPLGPGTTYRSGLSQPTGLAVDRQGNVFVVDNGNNRILRYPQPFSQPAGPQFADLVIGQPDLNSERPNQGLQAPTNQTVSLVVSLPNVGNTTLPASLAFDGNGNLYFTDEGNNRVLRYPVSQLVAGTTLPQADLVLGQADFVSNTGPSINNVRKEDLTNPAAMLYPGGLGASGSWLFVTDRMSRVLVYPFSSLSGGIGPAASRILGLPPANPPGGPLNPTNQWMFSNPVGVVMLGANPGVLDTGNNRIAVFDPVSSWPAPQATLPPAATVFIGQKDQYSGRPNGACPIPGGGYTCSAGLSAPVQAVMANNELYVADSGNNRVIVLSQSSGGGWVASRVIGQAGFDYSSPNSVNGTELFLASQYGGSGGAVAVDYVANPPHLYIADTFNNRVLGFQDARRAKAGDKPDLVIGQADLLHTNANYPSADSTLIGAAGLSHPSGLVVDVNGDLFVADSGNGRVLRFPSPFNRQGPQTPNLVLGQPNFTTKPTGEPTSRSMATPYGLALTPEGHLLVADAVFDRVLLFRRPADADFTNGMTAVAVFGQPDFNTVSNINDPSILNGPTGIASDTSGRLYVADTTNNRVMIYSTVSAVTGGGTSPVLRITGLSRPDAVFVGPAGDIWVADTNNNRVLRYPELGTLVSQFTTTYQPSATFPSLGPLALALDPSGNPIVAEAANRIAMFSPLALGFNAANSLDDTTEPLAPGTWAMVKPYSGGFGGLQPIAATAFTGDTHLYATTLGDVQLLLDSNDGTLAGTPALLSFVSPGQVNFLMPMNAPTSGTVNFVITRVSTGEALASGSVHMSVASPALFTTGQNGSGAIVAFNQDGTLNEAGHEAAKGETITLYGTGAGFVAGAPPDGSAPSADMPTPDPKPRVFIEPTYVPDANVQSSVVSSEGAGIWKIKVQIPTDDQLGPNKIAPGVRRVFVLYRDIPSIKPGLSTTIAIK